LRDKGDKRPHDIFLTKKAFFLATDVKRASKIVVVGVGKGLYQ